MSDTSPRQSSSLSAALWLAAGAAAGVTIGVFIAQRGGARKLMARFRGLAEVAQRWTGDADDADDGEEAYDEYGAAVGDDVDDDVDDDDVDIDDVVDDGDDAHPAAPAIDERVLAAFEQDPILSRRGIEIDTDERDVIVLTGRVPTADDAAHAVTIAGGVPGVQRVENLLRVRTPRDKPPTPRRQV